MRIATWVICLLGLASAVGMAWAEHRILGPDNADPPRGWTFDILLMIYAAGPCLGFAAMGLWLGSSHAKVYFWISAIMGLLSMVVGLGLAWFEATDKPDGFSPLYGIVTLVVVALQYAVLGFLFTHIVVIRFVTSLMRKNRKPQTAAE